MLSRSFFPNFGQGRFPKIDGKSPVDSVVISMAAMARALSATLSIPMAVSCATNEYFHQSFMKHGHTI